MDIRVVIVEDNADLAATLVDLVDQPTDLSCVNCYGSAESALAGIPEDRADVVLMDIHLPGKSGIECVRELKARDGAPEIIMLTAFEDPDRVFESMRAGAVGYLLKRAPAPEVLAAIREVHAGGAPMTGSIARKVVKYFAQRRASPHLAALTKRETEVLHALSEGLRYREIAAKFFISLNTVRKHVRCIYGKLEVHSRTEAVTTYLRR